MALEKKAQNQNSDRVNHPSHYKQNIECIDAMIDCFGKEDTMAFCRLNAFKYLWRSKRKDSDIEDIKKAQWYLNKFVELHDNNSN